MSKVFICYSHKDGKYLDLLLKHFDNSLLDIWSDKRIEGAEHWKDEIRKALDSSNCGLLILSANFFNSRFIKDIELEQLLKNKYEKNTYLISVLAEYCNIDNYAWIKKKEVLPKGFKPIENIKKRNHNKEIVKIVKRVEELLNPLPRIIENNNLLEIYNNPTDVDINNFPTSNDSFFGREKYLDLLDKTWMDKQTNIISFIAFGGVGKTALIDNWLKRIQKSNYLGANKVFIWSFYSQGSKEDSPVNIIGFFQEACRFFKIKKIPKTFYEQGKVLAEAIAKERALIILDGLEPLQNSIDEIGKIKDDGIETLLKRLSSLNLGLVVITSRISLLSINNKDIKLDKLEDYEGYLLLKSFELKGTEKNLQKISNDFDGHALALKLLGSYINIVLGKDITRIDEIISLTDAKIDASKHAIRMLNSYAKYLKNTVELDILKILSFFDRDIDIDIIEKLKSVPLLGINDNLLNISDIDWKYSIDKLKQLYLIGNISHSIISTHPLIREYFLKYIRINHYNSYINGNKILYNNYKHQAQSSTQYNEVVSNGITAIYHGCKAEEYNDTFITVYNKLLQKEDRGFLIHGKGSISLNLQVLSNYFDNSFSTIKPNIQTDIQYVIAGTTGYLQIISGNVKQGIEILEKNIQARSIDSKNYDGLIQNADILFTTYMYVGQFNKALSIYNKYIDYAKKSLRVDLKVLLSSDLLYLYFLLGKHKDLENNYDLIENRMTIYSNVKQGKLYLPSVMGYQYIKYLLYLKKDLPKIERRINLLLEYAKDRQYITDIGLFYLNLGELKILQKDNSKKIIRIFNKAITYIRDTHNIFYLIEGLIYRAEMLRYYKTTMNAYEDLLESYDLIIRSNTKIFLADWYIVAIKFALDEKNDIKSYTYFLEAKKLAQELNDYFIFQIELKKLESSFIQKEFK